jgi:hypothetical protein
MQQDADPLQMWPEHPWRSYEMDLQNGDFNLKQTGNCCYYCAVAHQQGYAMYTFQELITASWPAAELLSVHAELVVVARHMMTQRIHTGKWGATWNSQLNWCMLEILTRIAEKVANPGIILWCVILLCGSSQLVGFQSAVSTGNVQLGMPNLQIVVLLQTC